MCALCQGGAGVEVPLMAARLKSQCGGFQLLHDAENPVTIVVVVQEEHMILEVVIEGWGQWLKKEQNTKKIRYYITTSLL